MSLFALAPMMLALPLGRAVDRIGITRPMCVGAIVMGAGCSLPSMFVGLSSLYVAAALIGVGFMMIHVAAQYAVGVLSTAGARPGNFGRLSLAYSASSFFGPIIAGLLMSRARPGNAFGIFIAVALLPGGLALVSQLDRCLGRGHHSVRRGGSAFDFLRDAEMRRIYMVGLLLGAAWDLFIFAMPIHGAQLGFRPATISIVLACFAAATFIVRAGTGWLSRYCSSWKLLLASIFCTALCYALFPLITHPRGQMAVAVVLGLALGAAQPTVLALLHDTSPPERNGEATGLRIMLMNASQVVFPVFFGVVGSFFGTAAIFWGMVALIGVCASATWRKDSSSHQL